MKEKICGRCGGKLNTKRGDLDFCERCEAKIISGDKERLKRVRESLKEIDSGIYWTLKKKGKTFWFIPSPKLRKRGLKPHKL